MRRPFLALFLSPFLLASCEEHGDPLVPPEPADEFSFVTEGGVLDIGETREIFFFPRNGAKPTFEIEGKGARILDVGEDSLLVQGIAEGSFLLKETNSGVSLSLSVEDLWSGYYLEADAISLMEGERASLSLHGPGDERLALEEGMLHLLPGSAEASFPLDEFGTPSLQADGVGEILLFAEMEDGSVTDVLLIESTLFLEPLYLSLEGGDGDFRPGEKRELSLMDRWGDPYEGDWEPTIRNLDMFSAPFALEGKGISALSSGECEVSAKVEEEGCEVQPLRLLSAEEGERRPYELRLVNAYNESDWDEDGLWMNLQDGYGYGFSLWTDVDGPKGSIQVECLAGDPEAVLFEVEEDFGSGHMADCSVRPIKEGSATYRVRIGSLYSEEYTFHALPGWNSRPSLSLEDNEIPVGGKTRLLPSVEDAEGDYLFDYVVVDGEGTAKLLEGGVLAGERVGSMTIQVRLRGERGLWGESVVLDVTEEGSGDPYVGMSPEEFYRDYEPAETLLDSYYRTRHGFLSGSLEVPGQYAELSEDRPMEDGLYVKNTSLSFSEGGSAYTVRDSQGNESFTIFEGGGYITLEEVAAYLFAFGDVPANYWEDRYDYPSPSSSEWGEYLRLNNSYFSGDQESYPYEPALPDISGIEGGRSDYYEVDVGTTGTYTGPSYPVRIYNDGYSITRGGARLVYMRYTDGEESQAPARKVFYTWNHYNDFREYLNYEGGWGEAFGNVTAGGEVDVVAPGGPSPYVPVAEKGLF